MKNPWKLADNQKGYIGKYSQYDKKTQSQTQDYLQYLNQLQPGEFYMGVDDFRDAFKFYTIVAVHNEWQVSFIEKQAAVNKKNYRFNFTITDEMLSKKIDAPKSTVDEDAVNIAKSYKASES